MWRAYVIGNVYGKRTAMRDTKTYPTYDKAVKSFKVKNKEWMKMNYSSDFMKNSKFEYGAIKVTDKYKAGSEGNADLLRYHESLKNKNSNIFGGFTW